MPQAAILRPDKTLLSVLSKTRIRIFVDCPVRIRYDYPKRRDRHGRRVFYGRSACSGAGGRGGRRGAGGLRDRPGDTIVGRGRNRRETDKSALAHAEIEAIGEACRRLGGWRLWECTLYVTLEPCPMCAGAIINARIPGWSTALPTGSAALWIRCAVCFPWSSIITRKWKAASGKPSAGRC